MPRPLGPVELIVVGFPGNRFNGAVAPAIASLLEQGTIRVLDLAVVVKDDSNRVMLLEAGELEPEVADALVKLTGILPGLLSEQDLTDLSTDLAPSTTFAALLVEHVWATEFADAVRGSGGILLHAERIPGDVIEAAQAGLLAASATL